MNLGQHSTSLTVKDIKASRVFYEKLGFKVIDGKEENNWLIMRNNQTVIGLFQGMFDKNIITFNPGDVRAIQKELKESGIQLSREAEAGEGPTSIILEDPDGNPILIDQHAADYKPRVPEAPGKVAWVDLTVPDADPVRDFYAAVVGWTPESVSQGDYDDYNMNREGVPAVGICNQRGSNATMPAAWMVYFTVSDFDASLERAIEGGGKIVVPTRGIKGQRFAVLEDPAGAVCAIYES